MKFDYVIQNPPYQKPTNGKKKTTIWEKIVCKTYDLLKDGGEMTSIHPGGWRFTMKGSGKYRKRVKEIYTNNKIIYMELNNDEKGKKTFGSDTDYDVVSLIKEPSNGKTTIKTKSETVTINLNDFNVIPTDKISEFIKLKANKGDENIEILYSRSAYGSDKEHVKKRKSKKFKYPVLYTITKKDGDVFWYSSRNDLGHFGISKLILKRKAYSLLLDIKGDYGLCQYAYGIVGNEKYLKNVLKAMESKEFLELRKSFVGDTGPVIMDGMGIFYMFLREFKKEFWKDFV